MANWEELIRARIEESVAVKEALLAPETVALVEKVAEIITKAFKRGRKLLLFGNGGSAGDAQHLAAELVGKYYLDRSPLPAIALTVNTSTLTAIGNDYAFDQVFARQVRAFGEAGDIAVGISTSGNSENVVKALEVAKENRLTTVAFTGRDGGKVKDIADYCICISSDNTPRIQEAHIFVGHILCEIVERRLFGSNERKEK